MGSALNTHQCSWLNPDYRGTRKVSSNIDLYLKNFHYWYQADFHNCTILYNKVHVQHTHLEAVVYTLTFIKQGTKVLYCTKKYMCSTPSFMLQSRPSSTKVTIYYTEVHVQNYQINAVVQPVLHQGTKKFFTIKYMCSLASCNLDYPSPRSYNLPKGTIETPPS